MIGALIMRRRLPQLFAALRRMDVEAVCRDVADDAVWEFPGQSTMSGKYEGRAAIEGFWRRAFERYEKFDIRPQRIALTHPYAFGASNDALVEWVVDAATRDGMTVHYEGVVVLKVRGGKMVHGRDYFFDPSLLDPVWGRREEEVATSV